MLKNNFNWGPLPESDIITIKREIENENVYNKYRSINKNDIVIDIGASVGPFVCSIIDNKPEVVHCIEPSDALLQTLKENTQKYQANIIYHHKSISETPKSNIFCSNSDNIEHQDFSNFIEKNNIEKINFLKIDCEGCEYDIFTSKNLEFLQTKVSYIAAEFHLTYPGNREKFLYFRDNILPKFRSTKTESCTKQNISYGNAIDLSSYIQDNNFINNYNHTIMIYIDNSYDLFESYAIDSEDPINNYNLAKYYYNEGHTGSAFTHLLRAAERTNNIELAYTCLIKGYECFDRQKNRDFTSCHLLKQAISLLPNRPEAYFYLSRFFEQRKQWYDSYTYSSIGLTLCNSSNTKLDLDYPGAIGLLFTKAVAAYWWDKIDESRSLFNDILENYTDIPDTYLNLIEYNLTEIEKKRQTHKIYTKDKHNSLKFKFLDSSIIEKNYSQAYQDLFCLIATNGKKNGTYLEIGAGDPLLGNNTYLLETKYNWKGISIEINPELVSKFRDIRSNRIIGADATKINYSKLLNESNFINQIDYLQLDCEPPNKTFEVLLSIPFKTYKFGIITYEHDYYLDITKSYREKSRNYLWSLGYKLILPNISLDDSTPFEDWWVHPDVVSRDIIEKISMHNRFKVHNIDSYLFVN